MISAVVLTKNEEKNIKRCLSSLTWADEIIIIDDYSTDFTIRKIEKTNKKAKIYRRHLNNDFAAQRNYGLSKAKGDWILFLDADEIIPEALASEIYNLQFTIYKNYDGFYVKRRDFFMGREMKHGEVGNVKILRFGKRPASQTSRGKWKRKVHEYWDIDGKIGELENPILHHHTRNLSDFVNAINNYSTIHAGENEREGKRSNIWKIIFYPVGKFIYNYFFRLGFLDGTEGFIMAVMMSFHSFLAWTKIWLMD